MTILIFFILLCHFITSYVTAGYPTTSTYRNEFGDAYGNEWVFFPDENGEIHFVNMTGPFPTPRISLGDVNFRLYTRRNRENYEELIESTNGPHNAQNSLVNSEYLDESAPIKLVTHGWLSSGNSDTVLKIKDAYLRKYDLNVIAVDWSEIADTYFYPLAAINTRYVGRRIANFLDDLADRHHVDGHQIHLIGHSLGAHVMGVAASHAKQTISRVTGLDPARPLFEIPMTEESLRLDKNDAVLVDAIHTCAGILGFSEALGDIDFYPNGGRPGQPGCNGIQAMIESCSHGRSHQYFSASIEAPTSFSAYRCDSWDHFIKGKCGNKEAVFMGDALKPNVTGTYYLFTKPPPNFV